MKFIINFKTYKEASGKDALKLLHKLQKSKLDISACLQPADIHYSQQTKLKIWAQHIDAIDFGSNTGWILPENVKANGAFGTLINHSEHRTRHIKNIMERCKEVDLKTMLLAQNISQIKRFTKYAPDIIGIEPPKLIGSKKNSVADKPRLIEKAVKAAGNIPLYAGAGIKNKRDIQICANLGVKGVLIASSVVKARDPLKKINSFSDTLQ